MQGPWHPGEPKGGNEGKKNVVKRWREIFIDSLAKAPNAGLGLDLVFFQSLIIDVIARS